VIDPVLARDLARTPLRAAAIETAAQVWREHRLWCLILGAHLGAGVVLDQLGVLDIFRPGALWVPSQARLIVVLAILWVPVRLAWLRLRVRENGQRVNGQRGWSLALTQLRAECSPAVVIGGILASLLIMLTFRVHDAWKSTLTDYTWDATLRTWDLRLHGTDPWRILDPLLSPVTQAIDQIYFGWYYVLVGAMAWQAWNPDRRTRTRFFVTMALMFVLLGTVVAHWMASGGPVFYGGLVPGPNPYTPLIASLTAAHAANPLWAVDLQRLVWDNYVEGNHAFWITMSAMPSMHVAIAVLFACAGWATRRWLGLLFTGFALLIQVGSVHLGWHYAVDGYFAAVVVIALWCLTRRLPI